MELVVAVDMDKKLVQKKYKVERKIGRERYSETVARSWESKANNDEGGKPDFGPLLYRRGRIDRDGAHMCTA